MLRRDIRSIVMPRKRHVSRNSIRVSIFKAGYVMPRKRHVSRNGIHMRHRTEDAGVMPRKRHVSRNMEIRRTNVPELGHASQEACE